MDTSAYEGPTHTQQLIPVSLVHIHGNPVCTNNSFLHFVHHNEDVEFLPSPAFVRQGATDYVIIAHNLQLQLLQFCIHNVNQLQGLILGGQKTKIIGMLLYGRNLPFRSYIYVHQIRQHFSILDLSVSIRGLCLTRNMANFHFYFAVCLQLLTLNWRTSTGLPVPNPSADNAQCASLFSSLLLNITGLLNSEYLCHGVMPSSEVTVWSADTVQACAPNLTQNSGCMMPRNSSFSESECMRSILKDLAYYDAAIQHYLKSVLNMPDKEIPLLNPTLGIIQSLRKNCSLMASGENGSSEEDAAKMWREDSFDNRKKMCKMMRGFHVRAITINRALGYITSGDHRK